MNVDDLVRSSSAARHIAWAGEIEFKSAAENDSLGRTVQFMLRRPLAELTSAHPFSAHTRRRRGHAGTMFTMSLSLIGESGPDVMASAMLLNWGAGPKGETVTFLLNFEADRHPFLGCRRAAKDVAPTRWMAVFVEEDDASQAVDQAQRAKVEQISEPKQQIRNSNLAAQFIKNRTFWDFIKDLNGGDEITTPRMADEWIKVELSIDSKAELDSDSTAAARFTDLRNMFVEWQENNGYDPTK